MTPDPALESTIAKLYAVFGSYPAPTETTYSPHTTITADDVQVLRQAPLKALSGRALSKYTLKAINTWGDDREFRHYLPRILELIVREPGWLDVATILGKLETARWRNWPDPERDTVIAFLDALWAAGLRGTSRVSLELLALGAATAGLRIDHWIDQWRRSSEMSAAVGLADLITLERDSLLRGGVGDEWPDSARPQLEAFVRSPEARNLIEAAFHRSSDGAQQSLLSDALGILEALQV